MPMADCSDCMLLFLTRKVGVMGEVMTGGDIRGFQANLCCCVPMYGRKDLVDGLVNLLGTWV